MTPYLLQREQWLSTPLEKLFSFFSDAANLEALTPPWLRFRVVTPKPVEMRSGALIEYRIEWRIVPIHWITEIVEWSPPYRFVDVQISGPYKLWHHTHSFAAVDGGTLMTDVVRYALPLGPIGALAHKLAVRRDVERVFGYRAERVAALFGDRTQKDRVDSLVVASVS
jgi:hypothetical protein